MQELKVGEQFKLFTGKDMTNQTGCIMECFPDGGYALVVYMDNMNFKEIELLRFAKIQTKIIREGDFLLTLLKFANSPLCFEISFDPTLYKDDRMNNMLKSNLVNLIGVESTNNTIKTLRLVNFPMKLYQKMITIWENAKNIKNYNEKYTRWVDDLDRRYSVLQLWDIGIYTGKMGK